MGAGSRVMGEHEGLWAFTTSLCTLTNIQNALQSLPAEHCSSDPLLTLWQIKVLVHNGYYDYDHFDKYWSSVKFFWLHSDFLDREIPSTRDYSSSLQLTCDNPLGLDGVLACL